VEEEPELRAPADEARPNYRYVGTDSKPRLSWKTIVLIIVSIVVFTILPLAYDLGLFDPKPPEEQPQARLSGLLQWEAMGDPFGGDGGSIYISGDIHNSGEADGSGIVNMRVYDGYEWKTYRKSTGLVPIGGAVEFSYSISCARIIPNAVQVEATITH